MLDRIDTEAVNAVLLKQLSSGFQVAIHGGVFLIDVGEIEEGRGRTPITRDRSGRLLVRGTVRLKDAGDALGCSIDHPDVQSVSGLLLALLGRPAAVGDAVTWKGARIEVTAVSGRGVAEASIARIS